MVTMELAPQQEAAQLAAHLAAQIRPLGEADPKQAGQYEAEARALLMSSAQRIRQLAQELKQLPRLRAVGLRLWRTARHLELIAGELAREVWNEEQPSDAARDARG
jgi:hypothetical protein